MGQFPQGLTRAQPRACWASPGLDPGQPRPAQANFLVKILVKQNNRNSSGDGNNEGARARPFGVAVNAVVSVVLFDQNLDQKIDLGWPGSSPGLAQVKP